MCDINTSGQGDERAARHQGLIAAASWDDLALPELAPECVEVVNAFYRMRPAMEIVFGEGRLRINAVWPGPGGRRSAEDGYAVVLRTDNLSGEVRLSRTLLDFLFQNLDRMLSLDHLRPDHAAIVLEFALSAALAQLESALGWRITVESVAPMKAVTEDFRRPALCFMIDGPTSGASWLELRLAFGPAIAFGRYLNQRFGTSRAKIDLPVDVRLRVAATTLALSEIRALAPGDIVIADSACEKEGQAVAVVAGHLAAPVMVTAEGVRFASPLQFGRGSPLEWSLDRVPEDEAIVEASGLDSLPVHLVYEIGRWECSLGELRQAKSGFAAPFVRRARKVVDIVTNGKRIGQGMPVWIGESLGVRITKLFG